MSASAFDDEELAALLAQVALGDRRAFARLYGLTSAHLFGLLLRILKRRELAEDALQEAFLRVWDHAGSYRPDLGRPFTWLQSIARYRALDLLRRRPRELSETDLAAPPPEPAAPASDAAQETETAQLQRCLDELQSPVRRCLLLAYQEGCTHEEVSTAVDAPLGTVKSWIRRGLRRLKECLEP